MRLPATVLAIALALLAGQAAAAPVDLGNRLPAKTPGTDPGSPAVHAVGHGWRRRASPLATTITALPYTDTGSTDGFTDNYTPPCAGCGAPDVVYRYQPSVDVCVTISLCGSGFDTALHLYDALDSAITSSPATTTTAATRRSSRSSSASPCSPGHSYYIVVDGYGCDVWSGVCDQGTTRSR